MNTETLNSRDAQCKLCCFNSWIQKENVTKTATPGNYGTKINLRNEKKVSEF